MREGAGEEAGGDARRFKKARSGPEANGGCAVDAASLGANDLQQRRMQADRQGMPARDGQSSFESRRENTGRNLQLMMKHNFGLQPAIGLRAWASHCW